jgi:hypothetical protein
VEIAALEILSSLGSDALRRACRVVIEAAGDPVAISRAVTYLGSAGTPADLDLLVPLADFWKGDKRVAHNAADAIASIRERHGWDVDGPIAPGD